ncbi:MAG TPA: DUF354 domain-containing protein [Euryarchaeota archaeon]|nr:MAG: hypothetical protein DRN52_00720 [Thermococci archaeon]HDI10173.1 DUF354 domain-containing protein [Euryarchaeota archaeon]
MKVWIEVSNSPQVQLFSKVIQELRNKGFEILVTARKYGFLEDLLNRKGIEFISLGKHGGSSLRSKLLEGTKRAIELTKLISREKPDVLIFKHSPEAARVAFGLKIPSLCLVDNELASAHNKLVLNISTRVLAPKVTAESLSEYESIEFRTFNGVFELAHVYGEEIPEEITNNIIIRPEPRKAEYFKSKRKLTSEKLVKICPNGYRPLEISRDLEKTLEDGIRLISSSALLIGTGGTMNREAALLGVPNIAVELMDFPSVTKLLISKRLIKKITPEGLTKDLLVNTIMERRRLKKRAESVIKSMENPIPRIIDEVEHLT